MNIIYRRIYINVTTEPIFPVTLDDVIECKSIIVRDEVTIDAENKQYFLNYAVDNGEKISKNDVIAQCFENQDSASSVSELDDIEKELNRLSEINIKYSYNVNPHSVDAKINDEIRNISIDSNYINIYKSKKKIFDLLNEHQYILGNSDVFSKRIEYLKSRKVELGKLSDYNKKNIFSTQSGYFVNKTDGYEKTLVIQNIYDSNYDDIMYENIVKNRSENINSIGKIIKSAKWYLIAYVSEKDAENIECNMCVETKFECQNDYIPTKIEKIFKNKDNQNCILILSCDYMNDNLCMMRFENILIRKQSYYGFKIPKSALHMYDNDGNTNSGIYVKNGAGLTFKRINILYSSDSFVISQTSKDNESDENKKLTIGDMAVIRGINLYDGKCVL